MLMMQSTYMTLKRRFIQAHSAPRLFPSHPSGVLLCRPFFLIFFTQAPSSQVAQPLSPTFVSVVLPSAADTPIDANCNNVNNQNVCLGTHQDYVSPAIVRNFAPTQAGSTTTSYTHQPTVAASLSGYTSAASESTAPGSVLSWPPANIAAAFASCSRDFDEQQHIQEVQYQEQPLKHQETKRGLLEHRAVQTRSACTDTSNTTVRVHESMFAHDFVHFCMYTGVVCGGLYCELPGREGTMSDVWVVGRRSR